MVSFENFTNCLFSIIMFKRWTWKSPDGRTRNEIDFILVRKHQKESVKNVEVLNNFHYQSDHRMVRMTLDLKIKRKFHHSGRKITVVENRDKVKEFNDALERSMTDTESYDNLEIALIKSSNCFCTPNTKPSVISADTKNEIEKREKLLKERYENAVKNQEFIEQRKKVFHLWSVQKMVPFHQSLGFRNWKMKLGTWDLNEEKFWKLRRDFMKTCTAQKWRMNSE